MKTITEPSRNLPVISDVDVVVAGGGPGGIPAAIASARHGAKTLLIERYGFLGGMATAGLVPAMLGHRAVGVAKPILGGIPKEIIEKMAEIGGAPTWEDALQMGSIPFDPEAFKYVADRLIEEAGVELLLHTLVVDTIVEGDNIKALIIENKSGRQAVTAKVFIDATGDADVAYRSGAPTQKGRDFDGAMQSMSTIFRLGGVQKISIEERRLGIEKMKEAAVTGKIRIYDPRNLYIETLKPGKLCPNITRFGGDATDVHDLTKAEMKLRKDIWEILRFCRENLPGFQSCYIEMTAPQIGVRESRRIIGEYTLTADDILSSRKFPDTIALGSWWIDIHCPLGRTYPVHLCWSRCKADPPCALMVAKKGAALLKQIYLPKGSWYEIPYRSIIPKKINNLLASGRCLSATHEALAGTRVIGTCMAIGQAALLLRPLKAASTRGILMEST